ncbi:MAG: S41 family peptidase [Roseiflexaceae bacterium]
MLRVLLRIMSAVALLTIGFVSGWIGALAAQQGGIAAVFRPPAAQTTTPAELRQEFDLFWEVWRLVEYEYYGRKNLDNTSMIQGAIKGMLASLNDPATLYQEPDLAAQSNDNLQGKIVGIGTYLRMGGERGERVLLYKPIPDGPAAQAGLRQDDAILAIDGEEVATLINGLAPNDAIVKVAAKLRGEEGTTVVVQIQRASDNSVAEISLTRRDITIPSVEVLPLDQGVLYLRIAEFRATTTAEIDAVLQNMGKTPPRALLLDLRNNPGGLVTVTQEVLGRFYAGVALYEEDGAGSIKELRTIGGAQRFPDIPMVILVNGNTASASEIAAGALAEQRPQTTLLGEQTFGKGSVQNVHKLSDGGSARITFAHWLTPNKAAIHGVGITPAQVVPFADDPASLGPCVGERQPPPGQTACGDTQIAAALRLLGP